MSTNKNGNPTVPRGCDSPVISRKDDHLNRWPLAREVFGIATTGPAYWSVRIGIYGEWGSGKSSVLEFVAQMAQEKGHVLIRFNPWQYSNRDALWRAFVLAVYSEPAFKGLERAGWVRIKNKFQHIVSATKPVEGGVALINETAAKALGAGIDLIKGTLSFTAEDLDSLKKSLGTKRVIILIDDLDRTAAELVPEILFTLKELMNIPSFSFVCAFDPVVVGEVIGKYHPGFGNGLNFLDKIIDYPRWLPPPSVEGLVNLALADARHSCAYVPENAIRNAIPLLPNNPRAIRQFIRLLALHKQHLQRYSDSELHWPVIIAANILKVRYPRVAHELLKTGSFWDSIGVIKLGLSGEKEQDNISKSIDEHIKKTCDNISIDLTPAQSAEIKNTIAVLCSNIGLFTGLHGESMSSQFNLAEAPTAVTWKEFDAFFQLWTDNQVSKTAVTWITSHSETIEQPKLDVFRELLGGTIHRYCQALNQADNALTESEQPSLISQARSLFALLECVVFDLAELDLPANRIGDTQLETLVEKFASLAGANLPVHVSFKSKNEELILKMFREWKTDITPLINELGLYSGCYGSHYESIEGKELRQKLCAVALPKYARQMLDQLRQADFVNSLIHRQQDTFNARCLLLGRDGPLWKELRSEAFAVLTEANSNRSVQQNAYELLHWMALREHGPDPQRIQTLLSDQSIFDAIWNAATSVPLGPRGVYQLKELPEILKRLEVNCQLPPWWDDTLVQAGIIPAIKP